MEKDDFEDNGEEDLSLSITLGEALMNSAVRLGRRGGGD